VLSCARMRQVWRRERAGAQAGASQLSAGGAGKHQPRGAVRLRRRVTALVAPEGPARPRLRRFGASVVFFGLVGGNIVVIVWIWVANHNLPFLSTADAITRIGALTGLLAAYLALVQVLLLARLRRSSG